MARYTKLVPVRVSEIRTVVVFVVLRPEPRRSFCSTAVGERHDIRSVHDATTLCEERDHLAITRLVRQFVVGSADQKEWSWPWSGLPTRPWTFSLAESSCNSEHGHQRIVERERAVEITDANKDV